MRTSIIGYPRIGKSRELKFAAERYFRGEIAGDSLHQTAADLRRSHWLIQRNHGIDYIPSGDFSYYDSVLDTAVLFNIIPERYRALQLSALDTAFAMARGWQGEAGDVKALPMKKWYNTNYHYLVPEIEDTTEIRLVGSKVFDEYLEAKLLDIETKPVLIGPFTLLRLARYSGERRANDFIGDIAGAYSDLLKKLGALGAQWVQFDEPQLVTDLSVLDIRLFAELYRRILANKQSVKVLIQTYFGDVRDGYEVLQALPFDGIGLDFVEGARNIELIQERGFDEDKVLFAGVVNGKNIWRNDYTRTLQTLSVIREHAEHVVLSTSCSLLHVPYSVRHETQLSQEITRHLAFAEEKLRELQELQMILSSAEPYESVWYRENADLHASVRFPRDEDVHERLAELTDRDFTRSPARAERERIQRAKFNLPDLPTTTIGSFPQTPDVRAKRAACKKGELAEADYQRFIRDKIARCIRVQEEIGLDVLVHGEYERNDMVEYFGECLDGFIFTEKGWVQSYGTRCVKPPIIWGDVSRSRSITVENSVYANSLTDRPVKGMLTGPVTILNWSFPREDIPLAEIAFQIALAIRDEVLDLEAHGIEMIQIDEAALREKLPLRRSDWHQHYLSWAIPAFRLVHSGVKPETQIHTHMCYSQFRDILAEIEAMDADVITFEASRSDLELITSLQESGFQTQVGPGVYDIHSPRIPDVAELEQTVRYLVERIEPGKLWVNPDCGLKTRGEAETWASLRHMVQAAIAVRSAIAVRGAGDGANMGTGTGAR